MFCIRASQCDATVAVAVTIFFLDPEHLKALERPRLCYRSKCFPSRCRGVDLLYN